MAINNNYPIGLRRLYLFECTEDDETPVYGTGARVNCTKTLTWSPNMTELKLEGDDVICRSTSLMESVNCDVEFGGVPLDIYADLFGANVQDSGTGSAEATILDLAVSDQRPQLGWIAQAYGDRAGDLMVIGYRATVLSGPGGEMAKGSYISSKFTLESKTAPYDGDRLLRLINNETAVTISTTWASNPVWP
jgi:hypothetical protein